MIIYLSIHTPLYYISIFTHNEVKINYVKASKKMFVQKGYFLITKIDEKMIFLNANINQKNISLKI